MCQPFAQLFIVVDKAIGLKSADFNGLADPYVTLCLNGSEEIVQKSSTQRQTLAPAWNQLFEIDIHHPLSILTVTVFDEEYGDNDLAEVFGLEDVLAGWADIRVGALPLNEWTSGWFDLGDPTHYKDTLTGRLENPHPEVHAGVGRIHLKMILRTTHPRDELFAMCLPVPYTGHSCHLDLADLVHDTISLSKAMEKVNVDMVADIEWLLHHATPLYAVAILLIWQPATFLPALCILVPLMLIYISSHFGANPREVPHGLGGGIRRATKEEDKKQPEPEGARSQPEDSSRINQFVEYRRDGFQTPGRTSVFALQHQGSFSKLSTLSEISAEATVSDRSQSIPPQSQAVTDLAPPASARSAGPPASARSAGSSNAQEAAQEALDSARRQSAALAEKAAEARQKAQEAIEKADETEQTLKKLVHFMPKHAAKQLRKAAADMENIVQFIEMVENLSEYRAGYGSKFLTNVALLCSIPVALLLYWFADYQKLLLQITLTIVVSVNLWQFSFPGRMATGFYYYLLRHFRIRPRSTHSKDDDHESVSVRVLARAHIKHLHIKAKGALADDHVDLNGHHFDLTTFKRSTWCDDCGHFLWGVKEQGFYCKVCERVVCKSCVHSENDEIECPGKCEKHDFQLTTFHHATWCGSCDALLWGVHDQGYRCKVCCRVACHNCGKTDPMSLV